MHVDYYSSLAVIHMPVDLFGVWKPFEQTRREDVDLEVQLYSKCDDEHVVKYGCFHWGCTTDGKGVNDTALVTMLSGDLANTTTV